MNIKKRILSLFLTLTMMLALVPATPSTALAATYTGIFSLASGQWETGSTATTAESNKCTWSDPVLTVNNGADIAITGTSANGRRIEVAPGAKASITLINATVANLGSYFSPLSLSAGSDITVNLIGDNRFTGGIGSAAIQVPAGSALTINGPGTLTATGGAGGAGIGESILEDCGSITINSGNVTATGGDIELAVTAAGHMAPVENSRDVIQLEWSTTRPSGSFQVLVSEDNRTFEPAGINVPAQSGAYEYSAQFAPYNSADTLYFIIRQTDKTENVSSNTVKMIGLNGFYTEELGSIQEIEMAVSAIGYANSNGAVTLEWNTTLAAGSFLVQYSEGDDFSNFNTVGRAVSSVPNSLNYSINYAPVGTSDLFFRIAQTNGEQTAVSNIIKMIHISGTGHVPENQAPPDDGGIDILPEDEYKTMSKSTGTAAVNASVSMQIQEKNRVAFDSNVTLSMRDDTDLKALLALEPLDGLIEYCGNGIVLSTGEFPFPSDGAKLSYKFLTSDRPDRNAELVLCKIAPDTAPADFLSGFGVLPPELQQDDVKFPIPLTALGYDEETLDISYNAATGEFSAMLPDQGEYVLLVITDSGEIDYSGVEPPNALPAAWEPTSEVAKIVNEAGFLYDPATDLLYAKLNPGQRELGFSYFYDEGIALISSNITCEPIYFVYDNKEWLVEIWKGQYGIELGAEIGVYNRTADGPLIKDRANGNYKALISEVIYQIESKYVSIPSLLRGVLVDGLLDKITDVLTPNELVALIRGAYNTLSILAAIDITGISDFARDAIGSILFGFHSKLYDCVPDDELLRMSYVFSEPVSDGTYEELFKWGPLNHWWLTAFQWGLFTGDPHPLRLDATIWFPTEEMRSAFVNGYNSEQEFAPFSQRDAEIFEPKAIYNNDNSLLMPRGIKGRQYTETTNAATSPGEYKILPETSEGFPLAFSLTQPTARQPFITTAVAPIVNLNNKNNVALYNTLRQIVGCSSNDPNELEESVLKFTGPAQDWVRSTYKIITYELLKIVDAAFNIAKSVVGPPVPRTSDAELHSAALAELTNSATLLTVSDLTGGAGIGGTGGNITIRGGVLVAIGGGTSEAVKGTVATLPASYIWWANTSAAAPGGTGTSYPDGTVFANSQTYKYVKIDGSNSSILPFDDVSADDWFYNDVVYVYERKIFEGTGAYTFSPDSSMTRAMFVTALWRAAGRPSVSSNNTFTDVSNDAYYTGAIRWASANSIVLGVGNNMFEPDVSVTREQMASLIYRYQEWSNKIPDNIASEVKFTDQGEISDYAKAPVKALTMQGIINGKPGNVFDPKGTATRAEVAALLHRFMESVNL